MYLQVSIDTKIIFIICMFCFSFADQIKFVLDLEKEVRHQAEDALASLKEEIIAKDEAIEGLIVRLIVLEKSMETLPKMHQDSHDNNFLGMMDHVLEHNKKV